MHTKLHWTHVDFAISYRRLNAEKKKRAGIDVNGTSCAKPVTSFLKEVNKRKIKNGDK